MNNRLVLIFAVFISLHTAIYCDINDEFVESARKGAVEMMEELLENGADINGIVTINDYDSTALIEAASYGKIEAVNFLLLKGAEIDKKAGDGSTALKMAAEFGHVKIVTLLLESGSDINIRDNSGFTPLMRAIFRGHDTVANYLIKNNADINVKSKNKSAFIAACLTDNFNMVKLLLEKGADSYDTFMGYDVLKVIKDYKIKKIIRQHRKNKEKQPS